ncbi:MAG: efflux RND transporter periplasmic adaptor subunit [Legionellales bacterium]|nr:efflux RND transporter periplasmic adaptor subunit [Legionellales bacterium]
MRKRIFSSTKKNSIIWFLCLLGLLTSCTQKGEIVLSGYIEGEYTYIASGVGGTLINLAVSRGQQIKTGALLYELDPQPEKAILDSSKARLSELQVQLTLAAVQFGRQASLFQTHATSRVAYDIAEADFHTKQNQYLEIQSEITRANWAVEQKTMTAPVNGEIFDTFFRLGEKVAVDQPVLAILAPENIHVLFYVPETQLSKIKIGETLSFGCDSCAHKTQATISYISPQAEYTPPVIYSKDTRDDLVYLVRADMPAKVAVQFHPGQPVDVFLHE